MKKISSIELSFLMIYLCQSFLFSIFLSKSVSLLNYNFLLYLFLSIFLGIGIILIFNYLFKLEKNIFFKINNKFISSIFIFIIFIFVVFSLDELVLLINKVYLKNIDSIYIIISLLIVIFSLVKNDILSFFRCSTVMFYFYFFIEIITFILLLFYIDFDSIFPISFNYSNIFDHSYLYIIYLIVPIFMILVLDKNKVKDNENISKKMFITYLVIGFIVLIKSVMSIMILGYNLVGLHNYPDFVIYKNIEIFSIFERLEWLFGFNSLTNLFFLISLGIMYIKEGLFYIYKFNYYPFIIILFIGLLSIFINISFSLITYLLVIYVLLHIFLVIYKLLK